MNILLIVRKELLSFRDIRLTIFLLILPSVLILLMGSVMNHMFNPRVSIQDIDLLYKYTASSDISRDKWNEFTQRSKQSGIYFEAATDEMDWKNEVQSGKYTGYVEISNNGLHYALNSRQSLEGSIVQDTLAAFAAHTGLSADMTKTNLDLKVLSETGNSDFIKERILEAPAQPDAVHYFAIAVITTIIMYTALSAGNLMEEERKRNTMMRLMAAPVSRTEIMIGKVGGAAVQQVLSILLAVLVSSVFFRVDWGGGDFGLVFLILLTHIIFALSLGIGISYILKGEASKTVIMVILQLAMFFGGSYYPVENMTGFMKNVSNFSPLQWTNKAIIQIVHGNDTEAALAAMVMNIGLSVCLLGAAVLVRQTIWRAAK
ncbi:MAG: ABC transporter permease [Bacillota bacterium]